MNSQKLWLTAAAIVGVMGLGNAAIAQSSDSTQVPGASKSSSEKMSSDTTGTVATSGDHPKTGVDPNCKQVLANQAGHSAEEIKACGDKTE